MPKIKQRAFCFTLAVICFLANVQLTNSHTIDRLKHMRASPRSQQDKICMYHCITPKDDNYEVNQVNT